MVGQVLLHSEWCLTTLFSVKTIITEFISVNKTWKEEQCLLPCIYVFWQLSVTVQTQLITVLEVVHDKFKMRLCQIL